MNKDGFFAALFNGAAMQEGENLAGMNNIFAHMYAGTGRDPYDAFEEGRKNYRKQLRDFRYQSPYMAFAAETAGGLLTGAAAGRGLKNSAKWAQELVEAINRPDWKSIYKARREKEAMQRTSEEARLNYEYGKKQFNELRKAGRLRRPGHPDAKINKATWNKAKQGNNRETYDMFPYTRDIYSTGEWLQAFEKNPNKHPHTVSYDYYLKNLPINKERRWGVVSVANDNLKGRYVKNINGNFVRFLRENPQFIKENPEILDRFPEIKRQLSFSSKYYKY